MVPMCCQEEIGVASPAGVTSIRAALSGGDRRSLGRTGEVVGVVLGNRDRVGELFDCVLDPDEIVRMRAGDALEKVCRKHPEWLELFIDRLLTEVAAIDQPSVQWHLAQMIGEVRLTPAQQARAVAILKRNLEFATDWIVLNYSLEVFAGFVRANPALQPYFIEALERHAQNPHKSVAKRAVRLRRSF